jgi:hypothetical protein
VQQQLLCRLVPLVLQQVSLQPQLPARQLLAALLLLQALLLQQVLLQYRQQQQQ